MPQRILLSTVAFALAFLAPGAAFAGAAGGSTLECEATAQVKFLVDANDNGVLDAGETTVCSTPVVDTSDPDRHVVRNGEGGDVCLPSVIGRLRAILSLVADDQAEDNDLEGTQSEGAVLTLMLEIHENDRVFVLADAYTASTLGVLRVGNWDNRLSDETNIYTVDMRGALFLTPTQQQGQTVNFGALNPLGAELARIAEELGLVPDADAVLPIVADAVRDASRKRFDVSSATGCAADGVEGCGEGEVQRATASDPGQPLASVARYRLTIGFAEKLVGPPPACS